MANKLKFISYNAQGLKLPNKRGKVLNWASKKNFDVMAIQESHHEEKDQNEWKEQWPGVIHYSCGANNSRRVTFLIRKDSEYELIKDYIDTKGMWVTLNIIIKKFIKYTI